MVNQYVDYGCCNIVDGCRTLAYMAFSGHPINNGTCIVGEAMQPCTCCVTPDNDELPAGGGFVSPMADPAPWYNTNDPRSQHYLGAMIYDSWEESQPYVRDTVATTSGSRAKRAKLQSKQIVARFILAVDDCCAIDFAKAYFLDQFVCATNSGGACELPSLHWHECYDTNNCRDNHSIRGFPRAAVTNIDWITDEIPCCEGIIAEVTFTAELPWVYEICPETIVEDLPIVAGPEICEFCEPVCPAPPTNCVNPCLPLAVEIPKVVLESCYCKPFSIYRNCFKIDADNRVGESTLDIKVYVGSYPMRNFRIKGWSNPLGSINREDFNCVEPCLDILVPGPIPAYSTLEINGLTRDITLTCNNNKASGRNWVETEDGTPFSWPDISCDGLFICLEASAIVTSEGVPHTADDATISIYRYHRELR